MKKEIKKNGFKILGLILVTGLVILFILSNKKTSSEIKRIFTENNISSATQITCTYPQVLNTNYYNNEISHNLPEPEKNPMIFTFSQLDNPALSQLSYIDSTQSITNVPIVKLLDNEEKFIYLDGDGENYFSTHIIYKETGVSLYTKGVNIFGVLSGTLSMGSCVGY